MAVAAETLHLRGAVLPDGSVRDVFVVDGRITFTEHPDARTVLSAGWLIPGLVDAHAHLSLHSPAGDEATPEERVRASGRIQLAAGVLAVREPGSPDPASRDLGPHEGLPRTITAGRFLAAPGRYIPGLGREVRAEELPDAAEQEALASGAWCKIITDFPGSDGVVAPAFPAEVLAEAARRVHAVGARIAAHATAVESIEAVIEAGFDSIEHATELREDHISALLEQGIAIVPTLVIRDGVLEMVSAMSGGSARAVAEVRRILDAQPAIVRAASERGVIVLAGTDAGLVPHGIIASEIGLLLEAGLTPEAALAAGSWKARDYLGLPGITEGAPADLVAYADDPRADIAALRRPVLAVLDGRLVDLSAAGVSSRPRRAAPCR